MMTDEKTAPNEPGADRAKRTCSGQAYDGALITLPPMHITIQKFIEAAKAQSRSFNLDANCLTAGDIRLEVMPSTESENPTGFRLSFPSQLEFSDLTYPMLLLLFVFGKDYDTVGLMSRQAPIVQTGRRYTENIGSWSYSSYSTGSRWHMDISAA
jgi:hypothetical protein